MAQWEYKVEVIDSDPEGLDIQEKCLDDLGEEDWELSQIRKKDNLVVAYLKRKRMD
jgi:hypothetical protein